MGVVVPPGFANCRFVFTCTGVSDPMGFSIGCVSVTVGTAQGLAVAMTNAFNGGVWDGGDNAGNDWTWTETQVALETEAGPIIGVEVVNSPGQLTAFNPPATVCILVSKQTELGGRRNRGRTYLPAGLLFENEVDSAGRLTTGAAGAATSRMNAFRAAAELDGVDLVLFHSTAPLTPTPIVGFSASALIGTQRRRIR